MTTELPAYINDLVCCLEENSTDDEFIVNVVLGVMANRRKVHQLINYLQTGFRSETSILQTLQEL